MTETPKIENYQSLFSVGPEEASKVLAAALSMGGEYADLFFEHKQFNKLSLLDSNVTNASNNTDFGVGIRVINNGHTGYSYCENTSMKSMLEAAKSAAAIAASNAPAIIAPVGFRELASPNRYGIIKDWDSFDVEKKIPYLNYFDQQLRFEDTRVTNVMAQIIDSKSQVLFYNSLGECFCDTRPRISFTASCVMEECGINMSNSLSVSKMMGFEMLTDSLMQDCAERLAAKTAFLFEASRPKGGEMPVVMAKGASGVLLHEAMGHSFEADFNRKGISIFSDKMGKKICNSNISIVDDGTVPFNRGALNFDDEGVPGQKTYMVKEGILTSYLHDRISAKHFGVEPTGNGRRESFRYAPVPRMRLTYMEPGNATEEELISSVKRGIYCMDYSNGEVNIGAGDYSFFVKAGYLIENGKLTQPIRDINIMGNGPKTLASITGVANNLAIEDAMWTCQKGESCPVSCGMPSVLVKKLTVGGKL